MRTTINLPDDLVENALRLSQCRTKTALFSLALRNLVQQSETVKLKNYKGKLNLDLDLDQLRQRG